MHLIRRSLGTAAALTVVTLAAQANAMPIAYELHIAGSPDNPAISIHNMSAAAEITGFSLTIGDTNFNFDMVWAVTGIIDGGAPITSTLDAPDPVPDSIRSDYIEFSAITGFDAGDKLFFRTDIDPDSVDGIVDYRSVLTNNGGTNAVASVAFKEGTDTGTLDLEITGGLTDYKFVLFAQGVLNPPVPPAPPPSAAIPEPTSMALFGLGLAGLGVMTRRRRLARTA